MNRKITATVVTAVTLVFGTILVSSVSVAQDVSPPPAFKPLASVSGLMSGQGMMFGQLQKAVADKDTPRRMATIGVLSQVLAELSNVNQYHEVQADYQGWARELSVAAMGISAEASKGTKADDEKMKTLVRSIKNTCGACHDAYQD